MCTVGTGTPRPHSLPSFIKIVLNTHLLKLVEHSFGHNFRHKYKNSTNNSLIPYKREPFTQFPQILWVLFVCLFFKKSTTLSCFSSPLNAWPLCSLYYGYIIHQSLAHCWQSPTFSGLCIPPCPSTPCFQHQDWRWARPLLPERAVIWNTDSLVAPLLLCREAHMVVCTGWSTVTERGSLGKSCYMCLLQQELGVISGIRVGWELSLVIEFLPKT